MTERLTAMWVLTETGLGGFLHAFKLPLTGLFVGGLAVLWIGLIARFSPYPRKQIVSSGIVVLILKGLLAPQSPPGAYFALSIQIVTGLILFRTNRHLGLKTAMLTFATVTLSAIQKVIILTVLFGVQLWASIDLLGRQIGSQLGWSSDQLPASGLLVGGFLLFYALGGLVIGILNKGIVEYSFSVRSLPEDLRLPTDPKKKTRVPAWVWIAFAVLIVILLQGWALGSWGIAFDSLLRAALITFAWFFVVLPILRLTARWKTDTWRLKYQQSIVQIRSFLPAVSALFRAAYRETIASEKRTLRTFLITWLEYVFSYDFEYSDSYGSDHQR
ncbi:hypothetical protein HZ996_09350 [Cryomorphaceae bacterium]|nr:hypothetical protein HZ996_09350 [Cryomorphaceae bacterium]